MSLHYETASGAIEVLDRQERANQGSDDLTMWCPTCRERAIPMRNGKCGFCDTKLVDLASESQSVVISPEPRTSTLVQPARGPNAVVAAEVVDEPSLEALAEIANAEHARVKLKGRELVEAAIRAGEAILRAHDRIEHGQWIGWADKHLSMHVTTAHRYMRIATYRREVLASEVRSIEAAIQLLADHPRRGHGPRRYSDADKAEWVKLADRIGVKPAARALGVSPSTIHKWTSPNSPARGQSLTARQVTTERIERLADWLVERFGGYDYPERVTAEVRVDAAAALTRVFAEESS